MSDNMNIWDAVSKTDPNHTKKVNQRGGFTAIDAAYQIMNATAQFGPIGEGWGYEVVRTEVATPFFISHVLIWHGDRKNCFGPIPGCAEMFGNRPDADAPKKATTDAITKGLSQLGFNADVFLGLFDDNKYLAERKAEVARDNAPRTPGEALEAISCAVNMQSLQQVWTANKAYQSNPDFSAAKDTRKAELSQSLGDDEIPYQGAA